MVVHLPNLDCKFIQLLKHFSYITWQVWLRIYITITLQGRRIGEGGHDFQKLRGGAQVGFTAPPPLLDRLSVLILLFFHIL